MKTAQISSVTGNLVGNFQYKTIRTKDGRDTTVLNFNVADHETENGETKFYRASLWGKNADEANAKLIAMSEEERKGYYVQVDGVYAAATNPKFNDELRNASIRFIQPKAAVMEAQRAAQAKSPRGRKAVAK